MQIIIKIIRHIIKTIIIVQINHKIIVLYHLHIKIILIHKIILIKYLIIVLIRQIIVYGHQIQLIIQL